MDTGWIVLIEGIAIFGLLIGFGIWQLRSLKKMEREDKAKAEAMGDGAEGQAAESAFTRARTREADASTAHGSSADGSSADSSSANPGHPER